MKIFIALVVFYAFFSLVLYAEMPSRHREREASLLCYLYSIISALWIFTCTIIDIITTVFSINDTRFKGKS